MFRKEKRSLLQWWGDKGRLFDGDDNKAESYRQVQGGQARSLKDRKFRREDQCEAGVDQGHEEHVFT